MGADGKLPHAFTLEEKHAPNQIRFVPGALDGIGIFHAGDDNVEKPVKKIVGLLRKYFMTGDKRYIDHLEETIASCRAISLIDPILQNLRAGHEGIDPDRVFDLGLRLCKASGNTETVKIGMGLLGLLDLGSSADAVDAIVTLATYEEFTLYGVVAASNWANGNQIIFYIAQRAAGWGKIHAVERLEAETDEICSWILREGCANEVMDAYLGLVCATKGDMISSLRQDELDEGLFEGISIIINALLDEGPTEGISAYENAQEALMLYLNHAKIYAQRVEHLWCLLNLHDWAEFADETYKDALLAQCVEIINKPDWIGKITDAVRKQKNKSEFFYASNAASRMNIDVSAELFAAFKADPLQHYGQLPQLMQSPAMASQIIRFCEDVLPLDDMADGMGDYLFADQHKQEHQCLDFILQELAPYPMQGIRLIKTGLNSRVVRSRNMACRALSGWMQKTGKPLLDISPELFNEITRIEEIEMKEQTKKAMQKILNKETGDV